MIRYWNGNRRVEYVCKGYHRNGKSYCSSHRIHEEALNAAVQEFVQAMRNRMAKEQKELKRKQKNAGVEETGPQHPHFCVTRENSGVGAG